MLRLKHQSEAGGPSAASSLTGGISSAFGGSGGASVAATAADLDHLLAAKEQEMRAIAAERDRLRAEAQKYADRCETLKKSVEVLRDERERNMCVCCLNIVLRECMRLC